ncbi:hypothetical protein [Sphingobacterium hotanense]|uniref:Uncharacterized protein n=1 Tax=Sphingobacterium hotanense TaxID=649196 RepID=A0ABT7NLP2_9SPHI|nr:hypothetical protein [Sphingobacterium hotanense]MDM1048061.1 hypothetical protein [Sphingobacterium hotanense]
MDANQTELRATQTILQRGVRVRTRAPFLLRLLGKKTIVLTLRQPTGGSLMRMGYWFLMTHLPLHKLEKISVEEALLYKVKYGDHIYKALACLFLVGKVRTKLFLKPLSNYLKESLPVTDVLKLLQLVILNGGLEDFMNTTRLVRAKMITPPKLGQKAKRS